MNKGWSTRWCKPLLLFFLFLYFKSNSKHNLKMTERHLCTHYRYGKKFKECSLTKAAIKKAVTGTFKRL